MQEWIQDVATAVPVEAILRLLAAITGGAVIGWERERQEKPAGLRTHILVSMGAALFLIGGLELTVEMRAAYPDLNLDPMRVLAGVIGGVGFLGAGTIIQSRGSVRGITTAASIWISAAVGTSCGMGLYRLAAIGGLLALAVLWLLGRLERRVFGVRASEEQV